MHLLYLVFGSDVRNHFQATFSALTFLRQGAVLDGITVVTDAPAYYQHLAGHVQVLPVEVATLRDWRGPHDFFWRIKIKALEHVARQQPGRALVYLDSDTLLHGDGRELNARLAAGEAFMHEREGLLSQLPTKTERLMWQQVANRSFGGHHADAGQAMWNAGVVAVPAARAEATVALALAICDAMCEAGVTRRLIEQYALSAALAATGPLHAARPYIGHYWSTKEQWNQHISQFLLQSHLQQRTVADELAALAGFDFRVAPEKQRIRNTVYRLRGLVDRVFPPRETEYVGGAPPPPHPGPVEVPDVLRR